MRLQDIIDATLNNSRPLGNFPLPELLQFAKKGGVNGIAVSKENEKQQYLAILAGEAEGAIYIDEKGTLYGDKAVMLITGGESFTLLDVNPEMVEGLVAGSRIFEKSHLTKGKTYEIPEIGRKSAGMGVLTLKSPRTKAAGFPAFFDKLCKRVCRLHPGLIPAWSRPGLRVLPVMHGNWSPVRSNLCYFSFYHSTQ